MNIWDAYEVIGNSSIDYNTYLALMGEENE